MGIGYGQAVLHFCEQCFHILRLLLDVGSREKVAVLTATFAKWYMYVYASHDS